jgi:hypothetical protein
MIIKFEFDHSVSQKPLLVTALSEAHNITMDLQCHHTKLIMEFDLPIRPQIIKVIFACDNIAISRCPLTITNIVLDNFYSSDKILYSGVSFFDQQFLQYADSNQMLIDQSVADVNCLNFTGQLVYQFRWPFYQNLMS